MKHSAGLGHKLGHHKHSDDPCDVSGIHQNTSSSQQVHAQLPSNRAPSGVCWCSQSAASAASVGVPAVPTLRGVPIAGALLDHIGSYINPLRLVARIPQGMIIQRLRDRLVTIVADFRSQTSLRQCCSDLLQKDSVILAQVPPHSSAALCRRTAPSAGCSPHLGLRHCAHGKIE